MLKYNFCYPHQQGVNWIHHDHYSRSNNGNTLLLNFFELNKTKEDLKKANQSDLDKVSDQSNQSDLDKVKDELNRTKEDLKKANDTLKKCQSDQSSQSDFDKVKNELEKTQDELDQCKSDPNTCNDELNRAKEDLKKANDTLKKCQSDQPNQSDFDKVKNELEKTKDELDQCKSDPNICNDELQKTKEDLNRCKTDHNKCDKVDLDQCQAELSKCNKDDVVKPDQSAGIIRSQKIAEKHTDDELCGTFATSYEEEGLLNHHGFNTRDLIELLHPEMYDNTEIKAHIEDGTYSAANYVFAFSSNLVHTSATTSGMSCYKCEEKPGHFACKNNESKSICYSLEDWSELEQNKNLLDNKVCPNLISKSSEMPDTTVKQVSPLILVNESGQMIDRNGGNTKEKYSSLKSYLGSDGRIKDCEGGKGCKKFTEIMEEVAWDTNKAILLTTSDNENQDAFYNTNVI